MGDDPCISSMTYKRDLPYLMNTHNKPVAQTTYR